MTFPWIELLEWYKKHGRHSLPWRQYQSKNSKDILYRVWLSEIFLQQTQVSRVIDYFERVIKKFPTLESLANTDYETFFPYYQWLGYYSRARNILKTAKEVIEKYNGQFPREKNQLWKLPGVWPYTSSAILAFGYGDAFLAWDTNLEKVFSRFYKGWKDTILTIQEKEIIEADFRNFCITYTDKYKKEELARDINNALMDFGSLVDIKNPSQIVWEEYPIHDSLFYKTRWSLEEIQDKKIVHFPLPDAQIIVILHKDHQTYYSPDWEKYTPFILDPALHRDIRKYIQVYFRNHYNLELSVRPPQKKWMNSDGKPFILVNAQIQMGDKKFFEFSKKEYRSFLLTSL